METNNEKVTEVTENKKSLDLKKMSRMAGIVAVVLAVVLVIGIILSNMTGLKQIKESTTVELGSVQEFALNVDEFFQVDEKQKAKVKVDVSAVDVTKTGEYEAKVTYNKKDYAITVIVEDTTAPKVTMGNRYLFTNDVAAVSDFSSMVTQVEDASETTTKLVRFEKTKGLVEVNDLELRNLTEGVTSFVTAEKALAVGSEEIPTEPGIYSGVLEIADARGNVAYEEVVVILDTTGAKIEDTPDKTITVTKDKLAEEPEVDKSDYIINDNVDGKIAGDNIHTTLELRDEAKHEWLVHVSYTDRAGNNSNATFLITVKEEQKKQNTNKNTTTKQESTKQQSSEQPASKPEGSNESELTADQQKLVDAGYGNVVDFGDGTYGVLTHNDGTVDGVYGGDILREYLKALGLTPHRVYGGIIDDENDWHCYIAENIEELPDTGGEDDWHD